MALGLFHRALFFILLPALLALLSNPYPPNAAPSQGSTAFGLLANTDKPHRILLLTAHPDDECMFFAPTVLRLLAFSDPSHVNAYDMYSLCLSTGNADGAGAMRKEELAGSLDVLGVSPERRWVLDRPLVVPPSSAHALLNV